MIAYRIRIAGEWITASINAAWNEQADIQLRGSDAAIQAFAGWYETGAYNAQGLLLGSVEREASPRDFVAAIEGSRLGGPGWIRTAGDFTGAQSPPKSTRRRY